MTSLSPCSHPEEDRAGQEVQRAEEDGETGAVPQQEEEEERQQGQEAPALQEKVLITSLGLLGTGLPNLAPCSS